MLILGIHEGHNATAAILKDGKIIACASEERFSRTKNDCGYPAKAVDFVLRAAGVSRGDPDLEVAAISRELNPLYMQINKDALFKIPDYIREMYEYWKPLLYENKETDYWERLVKDPRFVPKRQTYDFDFLRTVPKKQWPEVFRKKRAEFIGKQLGISEERVHFIDHHSGHAHYAYFASPHRSDQKAAVITADGVGDGSNATISVVEGGQLKTIFRTNMCNLARIYRWITLLLGMKPNEHEYKVMGLAPYAHDYLRRPAYEVFKKTLVVDGIDFKWNEQPKDMYFHFREALEGVRFDGIAGGLQLWLEEMLGGWVTNVMKHTGAEVLYFSGGLAMNVKANKVLAELPSVKMLYVPPSGGDESQAIGAAFVLAGETGHFNEIQPLGHAYLGYAPSADEAEAVAVQARSSDKFQVVDGPSPEMIADLLIGGKVLGRCVGGMEFGARALGNRSIICDPSKYENIRLINEKIKFRDFWMPFTPSILAERAADYLINPKNIPAPYMTVAFETTPLAKEHLKASIHPNDFTARPQLVTSEVNPEYYAIIKAFEKKTGIGSILNTSFNLHGQPIVCTARDAWDTFLNSGLDGLILPGRLILKRDAQ